MFRIGQKVVFVPNGRPMRGYGDEIIPVEGVIYTIRSLVPHANGQIGVRLVEIKNRVLRRETVDDRAPASVAD